MARYALVDTLGLLYRAFFAMNARLSDPQGRPVSAIYGFFLMLRRLLEAEKPDVVVFGIDPPGPTKRHEAYGEYKAQRERMPEDLADQWKLLVDLLQRHGFNVAVKEGYESDDVIATLATRLAAKGEQVDVVTGDKDLLQLVADNVCVMLTTKGVSELRKVTPEKVPEVFGVSAAQVIEKKALMGDSSDNIPGVKGIGEKGADKLIGEYGTLEKIYENIDAIKGTTQKKLLEGRDKAFFSRDLVTLHRDVDLEETPMRPVSEELDALNAVYQEMAFTSMLTGQAAADEAQAQEEKPGFEGNCRPLYGGESLEALFKEARATGVLCLDLETTGHDPLTEHIVGVALSVDPAVGWYLPVGHQEGPGGGRRQWELKEVMGALAPVLTGTDVALLGHNIKFDIRFLLAAGAEVTCPVIDTMVAAFLLREDGGRIGLKALSGEKLGIAQTTYAEATAELPKGTNFSHVSIGDAVRYGAQDAAVTLALWHVLEKELNASGMRPLFDEVEMPVLPVLARMEHTGIRVDRKALGSIRTQLQLDVVRLEEDFANQVRARVEGVAVNMRSPLQLKKLFYEILELKAQGKKSTDVDALGRLRAAYPEHAIVFDTLLEHRQVSKLISTYVEALEQQSDNPAHRVHTSFSQTAATTGRLSSSDPNLQNIPIRSVRGRLIRRAFIPEPGWQLMKADYSQIELRVLAHLCGEPALLKAFQEGVDIHRQTAALLTGKAPDDVDKQDRDAAKRVNFGVIYGMGPFALGQDLGISTQEASEFIKTYFDRLPKVRQFIDDTIEKCREDGSVVTLAGRRRWFHEINSKNRPRREFSERAAVNTVIQGTAAEWMKLAMVRVDGWLRGADVQARLLLQVHDELVLEAPPDEMAALEEAVRAQMEGAYDAKVPLEVDVSIGANWAMEE